MLTAPLHPLIVRGVELYRSFLKASRHTLGTGHEILPDWLAYVELVDASVAAGLDTDTASAVSMVVNNVRACASSLLAVQQYSAAELDNMTVQIQALAVEPSDGE